MTAIAKRTVSLIVADDESLVPTIQEAFDHIVRETRASGYAQSMDEGNSCRYRGPDGNRCLVGRILPDSQYAAAMEGYPVEDLTQAGMPFAGWGKPTDIRSPMWLLVKMQTCHDDVDPAYWEQEFERIALDAGLEYREPQNPQPKTEAT